MKHNLHIHFDQHASLIAAFSSSPGRTRRFPVSFMDKPKSLITHVPSFLTRTFLLFRSRCETAGLYVSKTGRELFSLALFSVTAD